jgi:hypothetical protein
MMETENEDPSEDAIHKRLLHSYENAHGFKNLVDESMRLLVSTYPTTAMSSLSNVGMKLSLESPPLFTEPDWMKALRDNQSAFQSVIDKLQKAAEGLVPIFDTARKAQKAVEDYLLPLEGPLRKMGEEFATIAKGFEEYPANVKAALLVMSQHGWYLDLQMRMSEPIRFKQAVEDGRLAEVEAEMVEHFEQRFDAIKDELVNNYPRRRAIFEEAFKAHANGQYLMSIPVLLSQVDGICFDVVNACFFMGGERKKVIAQLTAAASTSIAKAFLAPFEEEMLIAMSQKMRPKGFVGLNRHTVLHGESVDYGTKENGFRAVSLLNYVSQSLQRTLKREDELEKKKRFQVDFSS